MEKESRKIAWSLMFIFWALCVIAGSLMSIARK